MPIVKESKPVKFSIAFNKMIKWMKRNRLQKHRSADIHIHLFPCDGGYIHLQNEDSKTFDFTNSIEQLTEQLESIAPTDEGQEALWFQVAGRILAYWDCRPEERETRRKELHDDFHITIKAKD